ncbi:hypothetical protein MCOR27_011352 [Pyricularia oryzae]|nr:hypothetical protein MCOR27_011352 [Pyricularia oryzae]KAI6309524.1 hypothetical protein MCOR30_011312 [Pyricularia oryzae]KAI6354168.1 hypothetical protein MCOR32_010613 [Pyricularia oryzae]KAI6358728.1 hypothetical protein MCOR31_009744 [Pyricularia oryzae]KAI6388879.1 hypothetical protein MCOR23_010562 [Pyricularia oryzae]
MASRFKPPAYSQKFPDLPQFSGFMKPCRFQGEASNLEVQGSIPPEIDGTFYRVMPDPQFVPVIENDPWFNGDGNISAFRIKDGRCDFKQRYVQTEKFVRERDAKRALLGKYRNKYTDAVEFKVRSTANTNIIYFNGRLLACKEDSPPYCLDPETLETMWLETFDGQLPSLTFTAHPKVDAHTGELICFGYEARGDGTPDVCYFTFHKKGAILETVWLVAPVVAMIHDFAVTENWVLFPIIPQTCDLERMKNGGEHWQWNPDIPFYLGVLPRRGAKGSDIKWFKAPNSFPGHTVNAYEDESGNIVFDLPLTDKNVFFWWPDAQGNSPDPKEIAARLVRFTFDPRSAERDLPEPEVLCRLDCEFPRVDDRVSMARHARAFFDMTDPALPTDMAAIMRLGGGGHPMYNCIGHLDYATGRLDRYFPGSTHLVQEPVVVPRSRDAPEGDGWVVVLVNNYANMSSELHIVDTRDFSQAQAIVYLPVRLRAGLHGNWVDAADIEG